MTQTIISFFRNIYRSCFPAPVVAEDNPLRIKIPRVKSCDFCAEFAILHLGVETPRSWSCGDCISGSCNKKRPDLPRPSSQTFSWLHWNTL